VAVEEVRHRAGGEQEERQEAHYVRDGIDGKFYATTGDYPLVILGGPWRMRPARPLRSGTAWNLVSSRNVNVDASVPPAHAPPSGGDPAGPSAAAANDACLT